MEQTISSGGGTEAAAPATFADAFAAEASPASDPSAQSTTPADAADPPTATEATPADDRSPFIPRARFDEVNTRLKDAEAFRDQYKWSEGLNRDEISQLVEFRNALKADPLSTLTQEIATLAQHPTLGPQLRSWLGRQLGTRQQQQQAEHQAPQPLPKILLENGQEVDLNAFKEQIRQETLAEAQQQFKPAMDAAQKLQLAEDKANATAFATGFVGELKAQYPNFETHKAEVGAEVKRILSEIPPNDPRQNLPGFLEAVTLRACNRVLLPKLTQHSESKLLDTLQQKAKAATSVNPGSAAPSSPRAVTRFSDLPPEAWK